MVPNSRQNSISVSKSLGTVARVKSAWASVNKEAKSKKPFDQRC